MKKLFLSLILVILVLTVNANPVDYQTARTIAETFATAHRVPAPDVISLVPEQMFSQLYVFGFRGQKGFVIISADDRAIPILGYSLTTEFRSDNMPEHILGWLHDYERQIKWLVDNDIPASEEVHSRWAELQESQGDARQGVSTEIIVDALVGTTWNQQNGYDNMCPQIGGTRMPTGCVATAMAQIMKVWNRPVTGHGSHSYQWNRQTLSADFENTTYDWDNMPNALNQSSTDTQVTAVATLMYHVGVSIDMNYNYSVYGGSSAETTTVFGKTTCSETALRNFFKYDNNLRSIFSWAMPESRWISILKNEMDNARPVLYSGLSAGSGHAFVCDGYDSQDNFHFNWGWGGSCDGFYAIGSLNPGNHSYNINNKAVIGIQPIAGPIPAQTVVTAAASDTTKGYVTGSGTYNQYDTIQLTAFAREGYMFDRWEDYCTSNPRYSTATSSTYNHTAYFKPVPQDSIIGYSGEGVTIAGGTTPGTHRWGFRYPASALSRGRVLDAVQLYSTEVGQYTVVLYQGDSTLMDSVYSETFIVSTINDWVNMILATPYNIDHTRSLWVTLKRVGSGKFMSGTGNFSGNREGMMVKEDSTWFSYNDQGQYLTWMMRAFICDSSQHFTKYEVIGDAMPANGGAVSPSHTRVYAGSEVSLTAKPADNFIFTRWSDGDTAITRKLTPTSDTTFTANFKALRPDTATYCNSDDTAFTIGTSIYWGIKIKAGLYTQGDTLRSVMIYDNDSVDIDLAIYAGEGTSEQPLHGQSYSLTGTKQWVTLPLNAPVACPENDDLWVTFHPQKPSRIYAFSDYTANSDGTYFSLDGVNWASIVGQGYKGTWMIKVIATRDTAHTALDNVSESAVILAPNPIHAGETAYIYGDWTDAELAGMQVEVLTLDGKTITRTTPQTLPITLRGINAPGTYIIRITTGTNSTHIRKLTVN